ncbi:hypothetical protein ACFCYF_08850 [Streptomyces chartreusis]|uniref:hypothetical protein n=1 Tax=Streptomyces chartreusis TaxID=1969 RepID=UPI0035D7C6C5
MVALLAVVAVVGYMAKAGLPWWVVAAVALLTAGFAAGVSGGPARGGRSTTAPGPALPPALSPLDDRDAADQPIAANVGASSPDGWDTPAPTAGSDRALR